nr:hypothetical protein CFP56_74184 [Quercus suber]
MVSTAWIARRESPSTIISSKPSSLAKTKPCSTAITLVSSTEYLPGRGIDTSAITLLFQSRINIPAPDCPLVKGMTPSTFISHHSTLQVYREQVLLTTSLISEISDFLQSSPSLLINIAKPMEYKWSGPLTILLAFTLALLVNCHEYSSWNVAAAGSPIKACPHCHLHRTTPSPGSSGASFTSQQCNCNQGVPKGSTYNRGGPRCDGAVRDYLKTDQFENIFSNLTLLRLRPMQARDFWTTSLLSPPLLSTSPMALVLPT